MLPRIRQIRYGRQVRGLKKGVLIKATSLIQGSIFTDSIVLISRYEPDEGAVGFIINKKLGRYRIGGPCKQDKDFIIHNLADIPGA